MTFRNYLEGEDDKPYFHLNSLAHYYEKMEGFAAAVENAAKTLNLTKEEIEKRIAERLQEWDGKLEGFDGSVTQLLTEWVDDGTFNHIIDTTLIEQKVAPLTALLVETAENTNSVRINALYPPAPLIALSGDNVTDDTVKLQNLINFSSANGGGNIELPKAKYLFKGTITLKRNVSLSGMSDFEPWNGNGKLGQDNVTYFRHAPETAGVDFIVLDQDDLLSTYFGGFSIKNLYIEGSDNSAIGLNLDKPTNGNLQNLQIISFGTNIQLKSAMKTIFQRVSSMYYRDFGLKVSNPINTSTTFLKCYFGQTASRVNAIPIFIEDNSALLLDFISCAVESAAKGIDLGSGNVLNFESLYVEHVPSIHSLEPMINIGTTSTQNNKGIVNFIGGSLAGTNGSGVYDAESKIINVNHSGSVNFIGTKFARSGNVIKYTANSKGLTFVGCYDMQVSKGVSACNVDGRIDVIGDSSGSAQTERASYLRRFKMKATAGTEYEVDIVSDQTGTDMRFKSPTGIPLWLDHNSNIRHNYSGASNTVANVDLFGAVSADFASVPTSLKVAGLWAQEIDGVTRLRARRSDGKITDLDVPSTGVRPATPYRGQSIYDTTLNKPIWHDSTIAQWKDAMGNIV